MSKNVSEFVLERLVATHPAQVRHLVDRAMASRLPRVP